MQKKQAGNFWVICWPHLIGWVTKWASLKLLMDTGACDEKCFQLLFVDTLYMLSLLCDGVLQCCWARDIFLSCLTILCRCYPACFFLLLLLCVCVYSCVFVYCVFFFCVRPTIILCCCVFLYDCWRQSCTDILIWQQLNQIKKV